MGKNCLYTIDKSNPQLFCLSFPFSRSRLKSPTIIVSLFSFLNCYRIGANSSIKVDTAISVLFNFGGLHILAIVICFLWFALRGCPSTAAEPMVQEWVEDVTMQLTTRKMESCAQVAFTTTNNNNN